MPFSATIGMPERVVVLDRVLVVAPPYDSPFFEMPFAVKLGLVVLGRLVSERCVRAGAPSWHYFAVELSLAVDLEKAVLENAEATLLF